MEEADDEVQVHGSRSQLQAHGSEGTEALAGHPQELDQVVDHDRSPGGADGIGEEEEEELGDDDEESLQQSEAQMQHQVAMDGHLQQPDEAEIQEALALAADMNADDDGSDGAEEQA